ncbi:hypothetical protein [Variovorax sp. Varisp36]|uniref:hypothetical protein n=1 Tax=Variovorax sp. Varisp36 TaxID=3243031 RepID=UPI0039A73064
MASLVGGSVVGADMPAGISGYGAAMASLPQETGGARHAALLLHAMTPLDRGWMLNALPVCEREEMRRLLAELEALGIERDATLIAEATAHVQAGSAVSDESMLMTLDESGVQRAVEYLRAEPVGLIAHWLQIAAWPWRDALLRAMEPVQRRRLEGAMAEQSSAMDGFAVPSGLRAALIEGVAQHVRSAPAAAKLPPAPWKRIRQSFSRLWGHGASARSTRK